MHQRSLLLIAGSVGHCKLCRGPGQMPGGGPGSQAPVSSEDPAV